MRFVCNFTIHLSITKINKIMNRIVGVKEDCNKLEIRKKYFEAAKKYHPDVTQKLSKDEQKEANEKFIKISQAYEILSDKKLKEIYDTERGNRRELDIKEFKQSMYKSIKNRKLKDKNKINELIFVVEIFWKFLLICKFFCKKNTTKIFI